MNKVLTYQDMPFSDFTPLLADSIQQVLSRGLVLQHNEMTVISSASGKVFVDPVDKANVSLGRPGIYQRNPFGGQWAMIGSTGQIDDLAMYLAMKTPQNNRYSLMVELMERIAAVPQPSDESAFAPG